MWSSKTPTPMRWTSCALTAHNRGRTISLLMLISTLLDEFGRPSFNILQNYGSSKAPVIYYIFDLMVLEGNDVMAEPLDSRRALLERHVLPMLAEPIRYSPELPGSVADLVQAVKAQGLEGLVAKRRDSRYEPGARSGAWRKMRINRGQEFVIGGYTVGDSNFDSLIFGYYEGKNSFTPRGLAMGSLRRSGPT